MYTFPLYPYPQQKPMAMFFISLTMCSWDNEQLVYDFLEKRALREVGLKKVTAPVGFVRQQKCILLIGEIPASHGRAHVLHLVGLVREQECISLTAKSPMSHGRWHPLHFNRMCLEQVGRFDVK